ncbi:MAG: FAD-dependent monooxygenase [Alphaproteobacteria bacterium]|nr:FAD-dependent monooxygenase [Alphaproteobacteria bacterium]
MVRRHAEIAGGGFAGLVAAIALAERGWSVRVHEKGAALRAFGAGIFIWENGLRVLAAIGAYDDVLRGAHRSDFYEVRDRGRVVERQRFDATTGSRMLTMTRQTLYDAILAVARRRDIEFVVNSEAVGASPDGVLETRDGRRWRADLVVGADGVGSKVRDSLGLQKERTATTLGLIRVLAPRCKAELGPGNWDEVIDFWNLPRRSLRILYVPCNETELYLALMAPSYDEEATALPLRQDIWLPDFPELEPVITRVSSDHRYDPYETGKLTRWSAGRVAIIGDAAHAMVPSLGQGAGIAMMNALSLAIAVADARSLADALAAWEAEERPRTEYAQDCSAAVARDRVAHGGRMWTEAALRPSRVIPTGTEHLPSLIDRPR